MRLRKLLRTLPLLALLMTGLLAESVVQAQEEIEPDEWQGYQKFNEDFNKEEWGNYPGGDSRGDDEYRDPDDGSVRKVATEVLRRIFKVTPDVAPRGTFLSIRDTPAKANVWNGSIWERDKARHGGAFWKVWLEKKSWSEGQSPYTLAEDGKLLRLPKRK